MPLNTEKFKQKLIEKSLITSNQKVSCIPIESTFLRKDYQSLERYKIEVDGNKKFILRTSADLKWLFDKYNLFDQSFTNLTPKVYLYYTEDNTDYLIEEFIQGITLEEFIKANPEKETQTVANVMSLHENLNKQTTVSTYEDACKEIEILINSFASLSYITNVDFGLIHSIVKSELFVLLAKRNLFKQRLSQADFIDRNMILTTNGEIRLVDLEFAKKTHFYKEEIIRFFNYSSSLTNREYDKSKFDLVDEIYFYINQIRLVDDAQKEVLAAPSFDHLIYQTISLLRVNTENFKNSRVVRFLNGDFWGLTLQISELNKQFDTKVQMLTEVSNEKVVLSKQVSDLSNQNSQLSKQVSDLSNQNSQLSKQVSDLSKLYEELLNNYNALINSNSWKLGTAVVWPIKKIVTFFKR